MQHSSDENILYWVVCDDQLAKSNTKKWIIMWENPPQIWWAQKIPKMMIFFIDRESLILSFLVSSACEWKFHAHHLPFLSITIKEVLICKTKFNQRGKAHNFLTLNPLLSLLFRLFPLFPCLRWCTSAHSLYSWPRKKNASWIRKFFPWVMSIFLWHTVEMKYDEIQPCALSF